MDLKSSFQNVGRLGKLIKKGRTKFGNSWAFHHYELQSDGRKVTIFITEESGLIGSEPGTLMIHEQQDPNSEKNLALGLAPLADDTPVTVGMLRDLWLREIKPDLQEAYSAQWKCMAAVGGLTEAIQQTYPMAAPYKLTEDAEPLDDAA